MQHFALGLAADGSLSLQLPSNRTLEFRPCVEALRLIERILLDHAESPDRVTLTQWEADAILRKAVAEKRELAAEDRRIRDEEKEAAKLRSREAKAKQARRALKKQTGIDVAMLKISL